MYPFRMCILSIYAFYQNMHRECAYHACFVHVACTFCACFAHALCTLLAYCLHMVFMLIACFLDLCRAIHGHARSSVGGTSRGLFYCQTQRGIRLFWETAWIGTMTPAPGSNRNSGLKESQASPRTLYTIGLFPD